MVHHYRKVVGVVIALYLVVMPSSVVLAATSAGVNVTVTADVFPSPINFTAVYVNDNQVDISWANPIGSVNVMVRARYGSVPVDRTDGYEVYYGALEVADDTSMEFDECAGKIYYRAWAEYAGPEWSSAVDDDVEGIAMTLIALAMIPLGLTVAMFATKQSMLGFPCTLFWLILGGYAFTESTTAWGDWQFYLGFGSIAGMAIFTTLVAYVLREKPDLTEIDEDKEPPTAAEKRTYSTEPVKFPERRRKLREE